MSIDATQIEAIVDLVISQVGNIIQKAQTWSIDLTQLKTQVMPIFT